MVTRSLGMIRFSSQQRIEEGFAGGLLTSTVRFDRNKNSVDFGELFRIVEAQNPATVRFAIHVQNAEIRCAILLARFGISLSPDLESAGILDAGFVIEIERIEDQGLVLRVETRGRTACGCDCHCRRQRHRRCTACARPSVREYHDRRKDTARRL